MPVNAEPPTFSAPEHPRETVPGQMIIRVRPEAVRPHLGPGPLRLSAKAEAPIPDSVAEPLDYLRQNAGLKHLDPVFSPRRSRVSNLPRAQMVPLAAGASVADVESDELAGITVASLPEKALTPALIKKIDSAPGVEFAEPLPTRWLLATAQPKRNLQWGHRAIRWFDSRRPSVASLRVAILDTGIETNHPDLPEPMVYDHEGTSATDLVGHGTHVAGVIGAEVNNDVGIAGISNCSLAVWKVFPDPSRNEDPYVDVTRFLRVLSSLPEHEVRVLNLSLGGTASSQTERLLFRWLSDSGIVTVAAMGNSYQQGNPTIYPAAYGDVLAVGAVSEVLERSPFSCTGQHMGLCAPGSNVLSTLPMRRSRLRDEAKYAAWSGTSMATPYVSGTAALVAGPHPDWTAPEIRQRLIDSARRLPVMGGSQKTAGYGTGLLDVQAAVS